MYNKSMASGGLKIICLVFIVTASLYAQPKGDTTFTAKKHRLSFAAGMGISLQDNSSFVSYLRNEIPYATADSIKGFTTAIEFFGGVEYGLTKSFALKLDYSYYLRSVDYVYTYNEFKYDIVIHQPYLMGYYMIQRRAFDLKFGIGVGYHIGTVTQQLYPGTATYKANGFSFRGEAVFAPYMTKKLQAYLSGFIVASSFQSLKDSNGNYLTSTNSTQQVNLSSFGVGARIGFIYNLY